MLDGERSIRKMISIPANPAPNNGTTPVPANPLPGCCSDFTLKVFADNSGLPLQNDVSGLIWWFDSIVDTATLELKKWVNNAWDNTAALTDNTYGTYGALGYFVNNEGQKFISYKMEWAKVLQAFGEGYYKVTVTYSAPLFGSNNIDSHGYCLKTFVPDLVDGTVRLEYWMNGVTSDLVDDTKIKDFGNLNWYNSLRLDGYFGYPKASYKEDDIQYNTGQYVYVEDEQTPIYKLNLRLLPFFVHEILRTDFMMADTLAITDYNSRNNGQYIQKYVRKNSGYEPKWYELQSNLASVEIEFKQQFNRHRKLRF